ncbi:MAG: hypothetical protein K6B28_02380 [Lachnospiraceae bacterium]|nr:hypothetical protein [Lachnospiraceae bacterium]
MKNDDENENTDHRFKKIVPLLLLMSLIVCGCSLKGITGTNTAGSVKPGSKYADEDDSSDTVEKVKEEAKKDEKHLVVTVSDSGYDIFKPVKENNHDYRYGPSMMLNDDNSIDAWFSAPADGEMEYDWISYRHSDDGGKTWSDEKMVLSPTPGSLDSLSACDPDVFYYDGYYYMGYTSTIDETSNGIDNSVFLARSKSPDGPFEKWNGEGWGKDPKPVVYYDGIWIGWGVGEPSFVILDNTLYLYTTKDTYTNDYVRVRTTELRTADLTKEDWPNNLYYQGVVIDRTDTDAENSSKIVDQGDSYILSDCDSADVCYIEEYGKFLAVCTNRRFTEDSSIIYYESDDGITFKRVSELNTNVICGCHNCGIMGDKEAHVKKTDPALIGYAYSGSGGSSWGIWGTRFAPLSIGISDETDRSEEDRDNLKEILTYSDITDHYPVMINSDKLVYSAPVGETAFDINYLCYDSAYNRIGLDPRLVTISDYDGKIIYVRNHQVYPKAEGITTATIEYDGLRRKICFCVLSKEDNALKSTDIKDFYSPVEEYHLPNDGYHAIAIRPLCVYRDGTVKELKNTNYNNLLFTFESEDENVCTVRDDGVILAVNEGETVITVTHKNGLKYTVKVRVG